MIDDDDIFLELANDENIAAAAAEHEAALAMASDHECPICTFFNRIHELRHMAEVFDAEMIVEEAASAPEFISDSMAIIQFLTEATKHFVDTMVEEGGEGEEDADDEGR